MDAMVRRNPGHCATATRLGGGAAPGHCAITRSQAPAEPPTRPPLLADWAKSTYQSRQITARRGTDAERAKARHPNREHRRQDRGAKRDDRGRMGAA
jgi:hypothetical protein